VKQHPNRVRVYPASVETRDGNVYALKSRAICTVGIADTIDTARDTAIEAVTMIKGGGLWYRHDIASRQHIAASINHMQRLRERDDSTTIHHRL